MEFRFANPLILLLLALAPALAAYYYAQKSRTSPPLSFSSLRPVVAASKRSAEWSRKLLLAMRILAVCAIVVALARPQTGLRDEQVTTEGIDIVMALDISSSMLAEDIEPNRVEAAKAVATDFLQGRRDDRIGLVVFSGKAYTQCPLTLDYGVLTSLFEEIEVGMIEDGTAIGMGLGVALNRLKESEAESKVIILLTDGRNNRGEIDPRTAAQLAQTLGVKIYAIGAGAKGLAPYPVNDPMFGRRLVQIEVDLDEEMLQEIAEMTSGRYFRATDRDSLERIYQEIDQLEKTEIEVTEYTRYSELFHFPLGLAVVLVGLETVLANTRLRRIP